MKLLSILFTCLILSCFACKGDEAINAVLEGCTTLTDSVIVPEGEKSNTCFYLEVYRYQSAIYTLCECCVCDKFPMAANCEGESLCDFTEDCMSDFYANAKYLFTVAGE